MLVAFNCFDTEQTQSVTYLQKQKSKHLIW